jgi:nucleoside-diphosphate-sugar epimerase
MRVAIAGASGKVALRLSTRLAARGVDVVGLIRSPERAEAVRAAGARPVVCDLEHTEAPQIADAIAGADAVVFAAGAGSGSGAERKLTVDRDGAIKLLGAAASAGAPRYLMISSIGAEDPPDGDDVFSVYLRAKAEADAALEGSDREWTILRPGGLGDEPGTGLVRIDTTPHHGHVPRDDVAAVLDALLQNPDTARLILYLSSGRDTVSSALEEIVRRAGS